MWPVTLWKAINERNEVSEMKKKLMSMFLALAVFGTLLLGCAGVSKETRVKCPKCGAVFTVDEGLKNIMP